jgi:hypothetical protein
VPSGATCAVGNFTGKWYRQSKARASLEIVSFQLGFDAYFSLVAAASRPDKG